MATAENPNSSFLSLRARLRTPECSQYSSGRVAQAARGDSPKLQEHLLSEFRKILATHVPQVSPEKPSDVMSASENYLLLEQLARSLAATGSNIHHRSIYEIDKVHEAVDDMILQFSRDSDQVLAQTTSLYETMAQPLAELPCPSQDGLAETISDHFALMQEEFANADDRIQALHEKWQTCVAAEQEAWQRLTSEERGETRPELELQHLVTAVDELTEYAQYIQIESLKVLQQLMEG
ncbi:hypothetical protein NQ176_g11258 [Zarea fungicola]|uniref:Uncharacterized protein n=1 Tax=Zarea fungicola TaxID=93591 RepID=A0ACC1MBI0_9HYPO|nr:hypothetical protein NQ176_g11258 [Lecanicillium fungicola]